MSELETRPGDDTDEVRAVARLLTDATGAVTATTRAVHRAVADRAWPSPGGPAKAVHDAISSLVYTSIDTGTTVAGAIADQGLRITGATRRLRPWSGSRTGRNLAGFLNGAFGDRLLTRHPLLATPMRIRVDGRDVPATPGRLAAAFPDATSYVVVFLHGLIETEEWWGPAGENFGSRLAADVGCTPVLLRYNTGRHISDNGRELADLVGALVDGWPVDVERIAIVGHSMGGLVARSAVHQADGEPWLDLVRHVVCLGTPHDGSPVERGANLVAWALRGIGETAPLGALLDTRSAGIKDLRHGYLDERDWVGIDPDELLTDRRAKAYRTAPRARQSFAAASLGAPGSRTGRWVGDLLVLPDSALSPRLRARRRWFGRMHHFRLLRDGRVYRQLRRWLDDQDRLGEGPPGEVQPLPTQNSFPSGSQSTDQRVP
ncbi:MAG TPA: hypothetical protein VGJ44_13410 [Kribbellaceae bacterium]